MDEAGNHQHVVFCRRHRHIGTEHILLGVLREGRGLGALVLTEAGADLDDLRRRVETALRAAA
ncbi:Clp protease N-terminal domain-containing protein [Micromonospora sp. NPDC000018]|uniref:Clp protease N-terminal domain-containing protein n=1 Tax=Micromonospora sp. NPDC000018 TaxID=3154239 RepID=UPI003316D907